MRVTGGLLLLALVAAALLPGAAAEPPVRVRCASTKGVIDIDVHPEWSPLGAQRFLELVEDNFFDDVGLFRAVKNFLVQFGIPATQELKQKWRGTIPDDPNLGMDFYPGLMSYAGSGPNSRNHQMFFTLAEKSHLGKEPWETPFAVLTPDSIKVVQSFFFDYGDGPPWGSGPSQQKIFTEGNDYLRREYPNLDYLKGCHVVKAETTTPPQASRVQRDQPSPPGAVGADDAEASDDYHPAVYVFVGMVISAVLYKFCGRRR